MNVIDKTLGRLFEEWGPFLLPVLLGSITGILFFSHHSLPDRLEYQIESSINIFSILVGFLGASLTIILAMENRPIIDHLKRARKYERFLKYIFESCVFAFLVLLISFVLNGLVVDKESTIWKFAITGWYIFIMVSIFLCIRVTWLLFRILSANSSID